MNLPTVEKLVRQSVEMKLNYRETVMLAFEAGMSLATRPRRAGLTKRERELLDFLVAYEARHRIPPSFDEMKDALGLRSKSGIHRILGALEERGAIRRLPNRARAIEVVAA